MVKSPKKDQKTRTYHCHICERDFHSRVEKSNFPKAYRSHTSRSKEHREKVALLNADQLAEMELGVLNEFDDVNEFDDSGGQGNIMDDDEDDESNSGRLHGKAFVAGNGKPTVKEVEGDDEDDDEMEFEEGLDEDDGEEVLSEDSFDLERKEEEIAYDVDNEHIPDSDDEEEGEEKEVEEKEHFAWCKENPLEVSYWKNPQQDLIGVEIKKRFGLHGWFRGKIVKFVKNRYYEVHYTDGDKEELTLKEVVLLIDLERLQRKVDAKEAMGVADVLDDDLEFNDVENFSDDGSADSKSTSTVQGKDEELEDETEDRVSHNSDEIQYIQDMSREDCEMNDILKIQEILLHLLYDHKNSPLKFNKVNNGQVIDMALALHMLHYIESSHMSRIEADAYLKSQHKYSERLTKQPFNMVKSYKTLKECYYSQLIRKFL